MIMEHPELEFTGRFRLVRKIAEGGMATVYEAEQLGAEGFTKRVALKVNHPRYAKRRISRRLGGITVKPELLRQSAMSGRTMASPMSNFLPRVRSPFCR